MFGLAEYVGSVDIHDKLYARLRLRNFLRSCFGRRVKRRRGEYGGSQKLLFLALLLFAPVLQAVEPVATHPAPHKTIKTISGQVSMNILAIETLFNAYFEKAICEFDLLARAQPLINLEKLMATSVMTPETQKRRLAELAELWRTILAGLPPAQRPPFAASEFARAIREGQMQPERLANMVIMNVMHPHACPGRLKDLGVGPGEQSSRLKFVLLAVFRRINHQGQEELAACPLPAPSSLTRLKTLHDLTERARSSGAKDVYAELERLKREWDAAKTPYRFSMPYRMPAHPCKSGEHSLPAIKHTLVNPVRNERSELWEAEWHEREMHGAELPAAVVKFLERLGEK